jgi:hypothetical protein
MNQYTFTNEIGNNIVVKLKKLKTSGIGCYGEQHIFDGINIQLIGPICMSEIIMSHKEALGLYKVLATILEKDVHKG